MQRFVATYFISKTPWHLPKAFFSAKRDGTLDCSSIRNLGIIAHIDAGKTTTTERMLFLSGYIPRIGDQGNTVMDYLPAERERGITIQSAAITFPWREHQINLIDTPGHADFTFEVERSIRVLDGAITILDAVAGVEAQTEKVWRQAEHRGIPRIVFVNKMDRVGAGFGRTVRELVSKLRARPLVLQLPIFETGLDGDRYLGICDLVSLQCFVWAENGDGKVVKTTLLADYPNGELVAEAHKAREALIETLSELDENIIASYLACEDPYKIPMNEIKSSIRKLCLNNTIVPILVGASFRNIGIQPLLDAIIDYLPSPDDRPSPRLTVEGTESSLVGHSNLCALAFKVIYDVQRGHMVFVRVYSGSLVRGSQLINSSNHTRERAIKLLRMYADETQEVDEITAGNIGVIVGLKDTRTGDTLISIGDTRKGVRLEAVNIPPPVFISNVEAVSLSESKGLELALDNLLREDPSLRVSYDEDTGQTLLSGMGELHLEIAKDRLLNHFKAKADFGKLRIGYRETITHSAMVDEIYEIVLSGKRAMVRLCVNVGPLEQYERMPKDTEIDGNLVSISLPPEKRTDFTRREAELALQNGAAVALSRGMMHGLPIRGTHVTLTVSSYDPETSLGVLSSAARSITQQTLKKIGPGGAGVLEPIMEVSITVDDSTLGAVMNDLTGTRIGQVVALDGVQDQGAPDYEFYAPPDPTNTLSSSEDRVIRIIRARVPLREMIGYSRVLRSLTGGRGSFVMAVDSFDKMSKQQAKKLEF